MGHNLDLCKILGVPEQINCKTCNTLLNTYFDEYDIDCGDPNPKKGEWKLDVYCDECDNTTVVIFESHIINIRYEKE